MAPGTPLSCRCTEDSPMHVGVALGAVDRLLPSELANFCSCGEDLFVTAIARHGAMRACQRKSAALMLGQRVCGGYEALLSVASLTTPGRHRRRDLSSMNISVAVGTREGPLVPQKFA